MKGICVVLSKAQTKSHEIYNHRASLAFPSRLSLHSSHRTRGLEVRFKSLQVIDDPQKVKSIPYVYVNGFKSAHIGTHTLGTMHTHTHTHTTTWKERWPMVTWIHTTMFISPLWHKQINSILVNIACVCQSNPLNAEWLSIQYIIVCIIFNLLQHLTNF